MVLFLGFTVNNSGTTSSYGGMHNAMLHNAMVHNAMVHNAMLHNAMLHNAVSSRKPSFSMGNGQFPDLKKKPSQAQAIPGP